MELNSIKQLILGYQNGGNPIEDPSVEGGIFVDEETLDLATKMEMVLDIFAVQGVKKKFFTELLRIVEEVDNQTTNPIETVSIWLDSLLSSER